MRENGINPPNDYRLQVFRDFVDRKYRGLGIENVFVEDIKNTFRGKLDELFEELDNNYSVGKTKSLHVERLLRNCGEYQFTLLEVYDFHAEDISAVSHEYKERSINILGRTLHHYYLNSPNRSKFVSELSTEELSHLSDCLTAAFYIVGIDNKECFSKVIDFWEDGEKIDAMFAIQKLFSLNNNELREIIEAKSK